MWHGFIDIVFSSHQGIPAIANSVVGKEEITPKKRKLDEDDGKKLMCFNIHLIMLKLRLHNKVEIHIHE